MAAFVSDERHHPGVPHRAPTDPKQERSASTRRRLLDAAVDELVEHGYAKLTTGGVAQRAGVSRGAQQHHFPSKAVLVAEAVRHLAARQLDELREASVRVPAGRARVQRVLDVSFKQYSGPLFAAMLELSLAARADEELRAVIAPAERDISGALHERAAELFGGHMAGRPDFDARLRHALSAVRGLAILRHLGYPDSMVDRQWRCSRAELARLLSGQ